MSLPTGTVTFLFTDIEGSTKFWEQHPEEMRIALARHNLLLHQAISEHDGMVFKTVGDAFCAAFASAPAALQSALSAQQSLQSEPWPADVTLLVRMALHTGTVDAHDGDYFGPPLNRVARLLGAGHGGQTLLSMPTYELTRDAIPAQCSLQDLGRHALRDLGRPEQVYQLCHPDLISEFPSLKSLDSLPNNLPQQVTSFIGREKELTQIRTLLGKTRLLTLTGSGGCGKTRLSLQTAADVLDAYLDGVWLIELAPITDPDLVPQTVASVLGVKEQPGQIRTQTLTDHLKSRTLLLILDNCEHLLTSCAGLADTLIRNCPNVTVLASSREGLGIAGELTYRVPSLSSPEAKTTATAESLSHYEAVQLFVERALFHKPVFTVTNANAPALASVCQRLDGIPLGIELAAARVRSLSIEEINAKMDNQFRLLTGGSRTALPRQQTLRALIDWSYDLLTAQEKTLLCHLSVFSGGWTLDATEVVCVSDTVEDWEVLDLLGSLVDKSLVQAEETDGQTRYRFLETVRQYGRDKLAERAEATAVRNKHAAYFLAFAEEASVHLQKPEQAAWMTRLETEHDNCRAALAWLIEMPEEAGALDGLRLAYAVSTFWQTRGYMDEGRGHFRAVLAASGAQERTPERAKALNGAGSMASMQNDYSEACLLFEESLAIQQELGDKQGIAAARNNLARIAMDQGNYVTARAEFDEVLATFRELGNKDATTAVLASLANIAHFLGDDDLAQALHEERLAIARELGNHRRIAGALLDLGGVASRRGDYAAARSLYQESMAIYREQGNNSGVAICLLNLGANAHAQGAIVPARELLEESLSLFRKIGDKTRTAMALNNLGIIAFSQQDYVQSRSHLIESLAIHRAIGGKQGIAEALTQLGSLASFQGDPVQAHLYYEESLALVSESGDKQGIATLRMNLGTLALDENDLAEAWGQLEESLALYREIGQKIGVANTLEAIARLSTAQSAPERAARLWGAAEALREMIGAPRAPEDMAKAAPAQAQARESLGDEAFQSAWEAGRAMTMEQAIQEALGQ